MIALARSSLGPAPSIGTAPPINKLRELANAVAFQAEANIPEAHAAIAPALAVLARCRLGLAKPLRGRFGLSLPAVPQKMPSPGIRLTISPGAIRVSGRQRFVAPRDGDRILVVAAYKAGGAFEIGTADRDLRVVPDEPAFGLSSTLHGWIEIDRILEPSDVHLVNASEIDAAATWLRDAEELLDLALDYGGLRGFLAAARTFLLTRSRPWDSTGLARSADDPHIVRQWGTFVAREHAFSELYEDALREADLGMAGPKLRIARSYARSLVRTVINDAIELLGASATSGQYGLDTFWRDLTAHELGDAEGLRLAEIGAERCLAAGSRQRQ
jgi:alkylation response protein AidB-like acyl-CoA dehydrogenase